MFRFLVLFTVFIFSTDIIHLYVCVLIKEMKVEAPVGEPMGSIVQNYGRFGHTFYLKDWNDNINLDIKGPWFSYTCCFDLIFKVSISS